MPAAQLAGGHHVVVLFSESLAKEQPMPIAKIGQTGLGQNKNQDPLLADYFFGHCCIRTYGVSIVLYSSRVGDHCLC